MLKKILITFIENSEIIRNWITFASDISILLITLYTFRLTFISKKIKVLSYGTTCDKDGNSYNLIIENRSLSPIVVKSVSMIVDKKWKLGIIKYKKPLIVNPFSTEYIEKNKYGYIEHEEEFRFEDVVFEIETSKGKYYIPFNKRFSKISKELKKITSNVNCFNYMYNNKIILPEAKYIVDIYKNKDFVDTIFILKSGLMTDSLNGIDKISIKNIDSKSEVVEEIERIISETDYSVKISDVKKFLIT